MLFSRLRGEIIDQFVQKNNGSVLGKVIENMPGKHWQSEIQNFSKEYHMRTDIILQEIHECLQGYGYKKLKQQFEKDAANYAEYYKKTGIDSFQEAGYFFLSISKYIDRVVEEYKKKLTKLLLKYPGIEKERKIIAKAFNQEMKMTNIEKNEEEISKSTFIDSVRYMLENMNLSPEQEEKEIMQMFMSIFGFQKMSWKALYRVLGLDEQYIGYIKEANPTIIRYLIAIQAYNNNDKSLLGKCTSIEQIKKELEKEIDFYLPKEEQKYPHPKIIGKIDLPPVKKKGITIQEEQEERQEETTDPLILVGQQLSVNAFLSSFCIDYDEIDEYIASKKSIPARYYNSANSKNGTLHFFTIGAEMKGSNRILINVSVLNGEKTFKEGHIYEIVLIEKFMSDKRDDPKKQSYIVKGVLKENFKDYSVSSSQKLGDYEPLKKLAQDNISKQDNAPKE